jgi:hypothetical protein
LDLKGKNSAVVFLATDAHFDVQRLVQVMENHIRQRIHNTQQGAANEDQSDRISPQMTDESITGLIRSSLQHVHIFRPHSLASLIATLRTLPTYLFSPHEHFSSTRPLHSVILDSATSFYWQYRSEQESLRVAALDRVPGQGGSEASPKLSATYDQLVYELKSLSQRFCCPIIATTTSFAPASRSGNQSRSFGPGGPPPPEEPVARNQLSSPWPVFSTLKIRVERQHVTRFAPMISFEEAITERAERQKLVEGGRFIASVVGSDDGFEFTIRSDGITFEEN